MVRTIVCFLPKAILGSHTTFKPVSCYRRCPGLADLPPCADFSQYVRTARAACFKCTAGSHVYSSGEEPRQATRYSTSAGRSRCFFYLTVSNYMIHFVLKFIFQDFCRWWRLVMARPSVLLQL
jgi:hypothetical protein